MEEITAIISNALHGTGDTEFIIDMLLATACGIGIILIYLITCRATTVSRSFSYTLLILPPISAMVAVFLTNNIILSVGMLGALSIIRYRHSMKEAKNLAFVFWAVSTGLAIGLSLRRIPFYSLVLIGAVTLIFHYVSEKRHTGTLVVKTAAPAESIEAVLKEQSIKYSLKYKKNNEISELLFEIKSGKVFRTITSNSICDKLMQVEGVSSVKYFDMR